MIKVFTWSLRRSGASITIEGRTEDDLSIKVTGVELVSCEPDALVVAVTKDGQRYDLRMHQSTRKAA